MPSLLALKQLYLMSLPLKLPALVAAILLAHTYAFGQPISPPLPDGHPTVMPGHPNYYAGLPLNFIAKQPRPGTFYYNDFNRYEYFYFTPEFRRINGLLFGYFTGTRNSSDFNKEAIIGQDRGNVEDRRPGVNPNANGNSADAAVVVELPYAESASENLTLMTAERAFRPYNLNGGFSAAISTVGYNHIQISMDIFVADDRSSAFYGFRASPDGGTTWTYVDNTSLANLPAYLWFNDLPSRAQNPQLVVDLSAHPEFDNNPQVVFQINGIADPETGQFITARGDVVTGRPQFFLTIDRLNLTGTALPAASLLAQWRQTQLGSETATGDAADDFDADGDGLVNLLEYALGGLPRDAASAPRPFVSSADDKLHLTFTRIADPALTYEVKAADDLMLAPEAWGTIWSSTGAQNVSGTVTVDDIVTLSSQSRRFLRLVVTLLP